MPMTDKMTIGKNIFENCKKITTITVKAGSTAETYCKEWSDKSKTLSNYAEITIVTQ